MKRALLFSFLALLTLNSCGALVGGAIGYTKEQDHRKELEKEILHPTEHKAKAADFVETIFTDDSVAIEIRQFYLPEKKYKPGNYSVGEKLVLSTHVPPIQMPFKEYHLKNGRVIYIKTNGYNSSTKGSSTAAGALIGLGLELSITLLAPYFY